MPDNLPFWNPAAQTMPPDQLDKLRTERLREAVDRAAQAPFFGRRLAAAGVRPDDGTSAADVALLPRFSKADLRRSEAEHPPIGDWLVSIGPPDSVEAAERALRTIADLPVDRWQLFPAALLRLREAASRIGYTGLPEPEEIGPRTQHAKISAGMECVAYLGSSCGRSAGAHLAEDLAIVEALDPITGEPVPDGERGHLVVTSLDRDNPMLRYDLQDLVRIDSAPCPCGETTRRASWDGRVPDLVQAGDVGVLPYDVWCHLGAEAEFVIIRPERPSARLRVRVEGARDDDVTDRMAASLGVPVDVEWVGPGELPRAAYKAQRVVPETDLG